MRRLSLPSLTLLAIVAVSTMVREAQSAVEVLYFKSDLCAPCRQALPIVNAVHSESHPIRIIDSNEEHALFTQYKVDATPTFIAIEDGTEIRRAEGVLHERDLRAMFAPGPVRPKPSPQSEPASALKNPSPYATAVRLRAGIPGRKEEAVGSGTVVDSNGDSAVVLTCGHLFKSRSIVPIEVELFDGVVGGPKRNQVTYRGESYPGELIGIDRDSDVALVRIRPGKSLPCSPVVPASYIPSVGMSVRSYGCSKGDDATGWAITIVRASDVKRLEGGGKYACIETNYAPIEGRSGGGLFTDDGYVLGVCGYADPQSKTGLYAAPTSIRRLLSMNRLDHVFEGRKPIEKRPIAALEAPSKVVRKLGEIITAPLKNDREEGNGEKAELSDATFKPQPKQEAAAKEEPAAPATPPVTTSPVVPPAQSGIVLDAGHKTLIGIVAAVILGLLVWPHRVELWAWMTRAERRAEAAAGRAARSAGRLISFSEEDEDDEIDRLTTKLATKLEEREESERRAANRQARKDRIAKAAAEINAKLSPAADAPKA